MSENVAQPASAPRALIVDDESDNLVFVSRILRGAYDYDVASSGEQALEMLDRHDYVLIITDQRMPGMSGVDFLSKSLDKAPNSVRIVVTGYSEEGAVTQAVNRAAVSGWLSKPFQPNELREVITNATRTRALVLSNSTLVQKLEAANRLLTASLDERTSEIRRSEQQLSQVIEQLPDAVAIVHDGKTAFANPAFSRLTGCDQVFGVRLDSFLEREDLVRLTVELGSSTTSAGRPELRVRRPDGSQRVAELSVVPITFAGNRSTLVALRDVTEQRLAQTQLIDSDRLTSLGMLSAGVAHEINNPLSYVSGNQSFARERLARLREQIAILSPADITTTLADIDEALRDSEGGTQRIANIVKDLRKLSRDDAGEQQDIDVTCVLGTSINMTKFEIQKRAQLETKLDPVPRVRGSETRLGQIFINLLMNAVQAIAPNAPTKNLVSVRTYTGPAGDAVIEVADSGCGIPEAIRGRIFDPFFTTKPLGEGTGLGLAICHGIVTSLGGEITVESRTGRGTTFRVRLPATKGDGETAAKPPETASLLARRPRVLIVDDEPAVARSMQRAIADRCDVVVIHDPAEAVAALISHEHFDIIFCDVVMPRISGLDLYMELRRSRPELAKRLVFVSGTAPADDSGSDSLPASRWIAKPFDVNAMRRRIGELLAEFDEDLPN
jgi:PAS domain S-box-containing protein